MLHNSAADRVLANWSGFTAAEEVFQKIQQTICTELGTIDSNPFVEDCWESDIGLGSSCVLQQGSVIEKGGVNFSTVAGAALPAAANAKHGAQIQHQPFCACGVSLVIHPHNPFVPTSHLNLRLIAVARDDGNPPYWWFGGGFDLTPYFPFTKDCIAWHRAAYTACQSYDQHAYIDFKRQCDEYFYLPHRGETRGIGGIFYDDLHIGGFHHCLEFSRTVGMQYLTVYGALVKKRRMLPYGEPERLFQAYRRGRYAEFNLLYDRGTLFGLQSKGRCESILMSLPPLVRWGYDWKPSPHQQAIIADFFRPRDWLSVEQSFEDD